MSGDAVTDRDRRLVWEDGRPVKVGDRVSWGPTKALRAGRIVGGVWRVSGRAGGVVAVDTDDGVRATPSAREIGARWVRCG